MSKQKTILITGAGSWIGREIALQQSKAGWTCYLVGKTTANLVETQNLIINAGGEASVFTANVTSAEDMSNVAKKIQQLDAIVCNAAIYPAAAIEDICIAEWREVIDVNLTGAFICMQSFLPLLKMSAHGRIIFISSIAGKVAVENLAHYCASKAGLLGLMRSAAVELAKYGITANAISPGNIVNKERFTVDNERTKQMIRSIPVGRTGRPEDIAGICNYLVSESASFITGQDIIIDGGESSV